MISSIDSLGLRRGIVDAEGEGGKKPTLETPGAGRSVNDVDPKDKPHLEEEDDEIRGVDDSKPRHRRGEVGCDDDIDTSFRMPKVVEQGQSGNRQEAQRSGKGEATERFELLTPEDVVERRDEERTGNQPGDVGVHHDHQAPVDVDIVRKKETGQLRKHQRTSISRPR